jgi:TATA-binding protein-associated factor Taf7
MHYQKFNVMILINLFFPALLETNKYVNKKTVFKCFFEQSLIVNNDAVFKGKF